VAIVTAIFLLVTLAGLAVAVVSLSTSQQAASAQDVQAQRAYQAAKAGMEWALYIGLRGAGDNSVPFAAAARLGCDAAQTATTFALPPGTTLSQFTVTVRCGPREPGVARLKADGTPDPDNAADPTGGHFPISVTACNQPGPNGCPNPAPGADYVQRELRAQL
jgi:MSHA biogenesis protein MshP